MDRRTFMKSAPALLAVPEPKEESESFEGQVTPEREGYAPSVLPFVTKGMFSAMKHIWGRKRLGAKVIFTVHKDGYDVRFV